MKESLEQGTKLVQAVADALFSLPSAEDPDGPIVTLPPPSTKLPREKPVCFSDSHTMIHVLEIGLHHLFSLK